MMYIEFMKNYFLADSGELMAVRLILDSWAEKRLTHFGLLSPKTFDSNFLDMMYVEFIKNFLLADLGELMSVRLILACWAKKCLIPTF